MPMPYWAEWAGLAATLLALGITVWQSVKARRASDLAREEVERLRGVLDTYDLSSSLAAGIEALDGIRRQRNDSAPESLQHGISRLRRILAELAEGPRLSDNDRRVVLRSQGQIVRLSDRLADAQGRPFTEEERAEFDKVVMAEIDTLSGLLARLRRKIG